jgi:CheY-like chemotaxis protein
VFASISTSGENWDALLPPKQLGPTPTRPDGARRSALIVEDDRDAAFITHGFCARIGIDGVIARTVADALSLLRRFQPDFILLDLHLPGRDGLDLMPLAEQGGIDLSACRVVVTTGVYARQAGLRDRLDAFGVDALLTKPFHLPQLAAALQLPSDESLTSGGYARPIDGQRAQGRLIGGLIPLDVTVEEVRRTVIWLSTDAPLQDDGSKLTLNLARHPEHPELPLVLHGRVRKQIELAPGEHELQFVVETTSDRHAADRWLRRLGRRPRVVSTP